ncbi:antitoxin VbhA family protein [Rhodococcus qingshengii]|uniref:antitoxin VbhA family protein n=1 Tax=Rhodococcus qingshengii TaxID=334542 RepID=UPI0021B0D2D9|nr:antitoxin VbhA family protein [Rhodococcus qingshengii]MCT6735427.1 antitoxin VbhA family protein [Rhodococcus qingshengii]
MELSDEHPASRTPEDSVVFATGVVRLAGGTVTDDDLAAGRRVASGETTVDDEISAYRAELGF